MFKKLQWTACFKVWLFQRRETLWTHDFNIRSLCSDFSLTEWMREKSLDLNDQLTEGAVMLLLDQLSLTDFFQRPKCDRTRAPYIPAVQGIHNGILNTLVFESKNYVWLLLLQTYFLPVKKIRNKMYDELISFTFKIYQHIVNWQSVCLPVSVPATILNHIFRNIQSAHIILFAW